jgi:aminoglycoside N3'-acetyltransferase
MAGALTSDELGDDLRRLGIRRGDVVMVHASLRAIGPVEGGAVGVVRALEAAVGAGGTLLMNLGARDDWAWVNDRPEPERAALLSDALPFDYLRTPADPDVGVLAEVFRQLPWTLVNDHPDGRFGARGARAADLLKESPWHDYYGPGSALERLVQLGGRVLRLGADPDTVTLLHYAEYLAPLVNKRRVRRHHLVIEQGVPTVRVVECLDDSAGIVDHPGEDYFALIHRAYLETGHAVTGKVGRARSELIEAADLVDFAVAWMATHLGVTA